LFQEMMLVAEENSEEKYIYLASEFRTCILV